MSDDLQIDLDPDVLWELSSPERQLRLATIRRWFEDRPGVKKLVRTEEMSEEQLIACFYWGEWEAGRTIGLSTPAVLSCLLHFSLSL